MTLKLSTIAALLVFAPGLAEACVSNQIQNANERNSSTPSPLKSDVVGTGRPMLLIPGLANSGEVWATTVAHFRTRYECHALTLAGFGGQAPVEGPFLETMRKAIANYIRERKLDKPILVGHSLGGFLALWLGVTESDLVGSLVVVDSAPCPPALLNDKITAEELENGEQIGKFLGLAKREDFLTQQRQLLGMWITEKEKLDRVMKWVEASDQSSVAKALGELWMRDLRNEMAKIKVPLLLIAAPGTNELRTTTMSRFNDQVLNVANRKVVFAERAKHFIMLDDPDWMWQQMEAFFAAKQ